MPTPNNKTEAFSRIRIYSRKGERERERERESPSENIFLREFFKHSTLPERERARKKTIASSLLLLCGLDALCGVPGIT